MTERAICPGQMVLPPLTGLPDFSGSTVEPAHVRREMALADRRRRARDVRALRDAIVKWDRESDRSFPSQVILIRVTVGRHGVGAVVDFRDHRVGMAGLRHRLGGALPVEPRAVLDPGPRLGLLAAVRALEKVLTD